MRNVQKREADEKRAVEEKNEEKRKPNSSNNCLRNGTSAGALDADSPKSEV